MSATLKEIAAMIRAALLAGKMPAEIHVSAYAREVVLTRNFAARIHTTGKELSEGAGRLGNFKQLLPDMHFIDTWLNVGEDAVVLKTKLVGTLPTGEAFEWPLCQIFHVANGVIAEVDFYTCAQQDQIIFPLAAKIPGEELKMERVYAAPK